MGGLAMDSDAASRERVVVVALTREAAKLALRLQGELPHTKVYLPMHFRDELGGREGVLLFDRTTTLFPSLWHHYGVIVGVMAAGIVVRGVAPCLQAKQVDPAVLVVDEGGRFVISLLSGHQGGANAWARRIASLLGATPVITTASDVRGKRALDLIALERGLVIAEGGETWPPEPRSGQGGKVLPEVMRLLLEGEPVWLFDPDGYVTAVLQEEYPTVVVLRDVRDVEEGRLPGGVGIWVSERLPPPRLRSVVLHPPNLLVGLGCNRHTPADEIIALFGRVFHEERFSPAAVRALVTVDLKRDEEGLREASARLGIPLFFVSRDRLSEVEVPHPSAVVYHHIGVPSVCEAAPIAFDPRATLLVGKRKSKNVTLAVAKVPSRW